MSINKLTMILYVSNNKAEIRISPKEAMLQCYIGAGDLKPQIPSLDMLNSRWVYTNDVSNKQLNKNASRDLKFGD